MPSYSSLQTKKQEHTHTHTHLREREQVHEFADEERVVAVIGAEVRAQQREILRSFLAFLSLLTEVRQHIHVIFDPLMDGLQVHQ